MTEPAHLLSIAEKELTAVSDLLAAHKRTCTADCPQCVSLAGHVARAGRQVQLFDADNAETESMF